MQAVVVTVETFRNFDEFDSERRLAFRNIRREFID